jgi:hypothetical protein
MVLSIIFLEDKHKILLHLSILILCLSSRNMIDKTMCEVLWRNISDFYVNLRVEVAAVSRNRYGVEKTVDTHKTHGFVYHISWRQT